MKGVISCQIFLRVKTVRVKLTWKPTYKRWKCTSLIGILEIFTKNHEIFNI